MAKRSSKRRRKTRKRTRKKTNGGGKMVVRPMGAGHQGVKWWGREPVKEYHLMGFEVTWDALPSPVIDRLPAALRERIEALYFRFQEGPEDLVDELRELWEACPEVEVLGNWLSQALRSAGRDAEAWEITERLNRERPDYFFGWMVRAEMLWEKGDLEGVDRVLGAVRDPRHLAPGREVFHISEVRQYFTLCSKYLIMDGKLEAAASYRDLLDEMEPGSPGVEEIDRLMRPEVAARLQMLAEVARLAAEAEKFASVASPRRRRRRKPRSEPVEQTMELFPLAEITR